ncbi:acetyl-acetyltransferase, putative [Babesia ovata]|uniref:Acetyl-acetyltransferase, putative n=1 Tax=Babesia ovata TaxID=189622 RepID=A0A2H6KHI3_9APIC|nr:acetyl-acetyltransferase, putative [Babesia ovata]GBE62429.1 acetyl-acetyltransferase, putative [Babesia ovata]
MTPLPKRWERTAHPKSLELAMLESMANKNAPMLKSNSFTDANATPPTTGSRARYVNTLRNSRKHMMERIAVVTGSADLTTCVKDTAPRPMEMTAP